MLSYPLEPSRESRRLAAAVIPEDKQDSKREERREKRPDRVMLVGGWAVGSVLLVLLIASDRPQGRPNEEGEAVTSHMTSPLPVFHTFHTTTTRVI